MTELSRMNSEKLELFRMRHAELYGDESARYAVQTLASWLRGSVKPKADSIRQVVNVAIELLSDDAKKYIFERELSEYLKYRAEGLRLPASLELIEQQLNAIANNPTSLYRSFWGYSASFIDLEVIEARISMSVLEYYLSIRPVVVQLAAILGHREILGLVVRPDVSISLYGKTAHSSLSWSSMASAEEFCRTIPTILETIDAACIRRGLIPSAGIDTGYGMQLNHSELQKAIRSHVRDVIRRTIARTEYNIEYDRSVVEDGLLWHYSVSFNLTSIETEAGRIKMSFATIVVIGLYLAWLVPTRLWIIVLICAFVIPMMFFRIMDTRRRIREVREYKRSLEQLLTSIPSTT